MMYVRLSSLTVRLESLTHDSHNGIAVGQLARPSSAEQEIGDDSAT